MLEVVLTRNEDQTLNVKAGWFEHPQMKEEHLSFLATGFIDLQDDVDIKSDDEQLKNRFIQLVKRVQSPEYVGYPRPLINYLRNLWRTDRYDFEACQNLLTGRPLIFCGAGPSLEEHKEYLTNTNNFVIAGGSAITWFHRHGIKPSLAYAFDPNDEELKRFKDIDWPDVPLLYKGRLSPEIASNWKGPKLWIKGNGQPATSKLEGANYDFLGTGISVTTSIFAIANFLDASEVYLIGVDLGDTLYPESLKDLEESADLERRKELFEDEKRTIEEQIAKYPNRRVLTASTELSGISKGTPPANASNSIVAPLKRFNRQYWRRIKKSVVKWVEELESFLQNEEFDINDLLSMNVTQTLLKSHKDIALNRYRVTGVLNLKGVILAMEESLPILKRIAQW